MRYPMLVTALIVLSPLAFIASASAGGDPLIPGWEDMIPGRPLPKTAYQTCTLERDDVYTCKPCRKDALVPCVEIMVSGPRATIDMVLIAAGGDDGDKRALVHMGIFGAFTRAEWGPAHVESSDREIKQECWQGESLMVMRATSYYALDTCALGFTPCNKRFRYKQPRVVVYLADGVMCPGYGPARAKKDPSASPISTPD